MDVQNKTNEDHQKTIDELRVNKEKLNAEKCKLVVDHAEVIKGKTA